MSLSIYFCDEDGNDVDSEHLNITHNLGWGMARHVEDHDNLTNLYQLVWDSDTEFGYDNGKIPVRYILEHLPPCINILAQNKEHYSQYNPENGWGSYDYLLDFCLRYYAECCKHPHAFVYLCR